MSFLLPLSPSLFPLFLVKEDENGGRGRTRGEDDRGTTKSDQIDFGAKRAGVYKLFHA